MTAPCRHFQARGAAELCHWQKIGIMAQPKDPRREALVQDLRSFRKGVGVPSPERLDGLFDLVDALGDGIVERAFGELDRYYREHGQDPLSAIGAFFYLSGWGVGLDSVNQRRSVYVQQYPCDESTAWRRAQRGLQQLATLIRDGDERQRPWAFVAIFQSGPRFHPIIQFNLAYESWRPPLIQINGEEVPFDFVLHRDPSEPDRFLHRVILPEYPLNLEAGLSEPMAIVRVTWAMPVWPVWSLSNWVADPRISMMMRTFRDRAVEVSIHWRESVTAEEQAAVLAGLDDGGHLHEGVG